MKAYLYCTKAKQYLIDDMDVFPEQCKEEHYTLEDDKHYDGIGLNGSVCFECEINKVEEIRHGYSPLGDDLFFTKSVSIPVDFERQTCLNTEQLNSYQPRYALYLENVKKIDKPFPISTAPQNMMNYKHCNCILISIQPQHLANIANGLKSIEVRKSILNELKELIK